MSLLKEMLEKNGIKSSESADANNGNTVPSADGTDQTDKLNAAAGAAGAGAAPGSNTDSAAASGQGGQSDDDIADDLVLKALNKRGFNVKTLGDLGKPAPAADLPLTEEQKKAAAEERQNRITTYGLSKGKINKTQLDKFTIDSNKDPIELVFELYRKERLSELKEQKVPADKIPTEDDLYKEFSEYNHLEYDETDPKRVRREKELIAQADEWLKNTYKGIYDLDKDYEDHESSIQTRAGYDTTVETALSKIPTELVQSIPDITDKSGKASLSYKYKPSPQTIATLKEKYGKDEQYNLLGKGNLSPEALSSIMLNEMKLMDFDRIVAEVAHAHATAEILKIQKGRRHIIETTGAEGSGTPIESSPVMKKILNENKEILQSN